MLGTLDPSSICWVALLLLAVWVIYGAVWRLYWSPLAGFPGPKSVALTFWVEFYYDVIKNGMYMWEVEKMHAKYGEYFLPALVSSLRGTILTNS